MYSHVLQFWGQEQMPEEDEAEVKVLMEPHPLFGLFGYNLSPFLSLSLFFKWSDLNFVLAENISS